MKTDNAWLFVLYVLFILLLTAISMTVLFIGIKTAFNLSFMDITFNSIIALSFGFIFIAVPIKFNIDTDINTFLQLIIIYIISFILSFLLNILAIFLILYGISQIFVLNINITWIPVLLLSIGFAIIKLLISNNYKTI